MKRRWTRYGAILLAVLLLAACGSGEDAVSAGGGAEIPDPAAQGTEYPPEAKYIALTFDDGPGPYTERLLDGLKERGVKASFFLIGRSVKEYPEAVKRMEEEGHLIGNHTYSHVKLKGLSPEETRREIQKTDEAVYEITGKHVAYLRPPFGEWEEDLELTYPVLPVMWTVDPLDWTTENVEEIVDRVVTQAGENDMILLHDCYDSSVEAALQIVDRLLAEGFDFVRVDELLIP